MSTIRCQFQWAEMGQLQRPIYCIKLSAQSFFFLISGLNRIQLPSGLWFIFYDLIFSNISKLLQ
jgi:hypothetical protein